MSTRISNNLRNVIAEMNRATIASGRVSSDVTLVAVTKNQNVEDIVAYCHAAREFGIRPVLGESYLQEYKSKRSQVPPDVELHMIGPLQSKKVRDAVEFFDLIQSVHSRRILDLISREAERLQKTQRILLQVNISEDSKKAGFCPSQLREELVYAAQLPGLSVEGIMTITALYDEPEMARRDFRAMHALIEGCWKGCMANRQPIVSMGMSADFGIAIEEGGTMVRIGSALFGERPPVSEIGGECS